MTTTMLAGSLLAGALLAMGPAARAQTLLDATGASAIQGTLNSTATPQYGGTLQQVRNSLGKAESQGSQGISPNNLNPSGGSSPGGSASTGPGTYVNGHLVAVCSHGGLCLGQLRRAMRRP
ncbi:hypothetical protein [Vulcanococcus limneticus]|uniref:hypothetical protein n=1 Tax=Vulcanococcus limneticus TaxID=2170428 RepID=UPI00398C2102